MGSIILKIMFSVVFTGILCFVVLEKPDKTSELAANIPVTHEIEKTTDLKLSSIQPLPYKLELDSRKVSLGRELFHDERLSHNNTISCASCHNLELGGADRLSVSIGIDGQQGDMNAPTVFNSHFNFKQFWDGRADSLEDQVEGPVHHPKEMGSSWQEVVEKLNQDLNYVKQFKEIYKEDIEPQHVQDAIAEFERSLITPNSRFDKYLRGHKEILTENEIKGYELFQKIGCTACHQGVNVGGNSFQRIGQFSDFFKGREIKKRDMGRYNVTKRERDKYKFKVPSLRNVALTAPYFHAGSVLTLEEAVVLMSQYQLGYEITKEEVDRLVDFLKTLTGEYQGHSLDK